MARTKLAAVAVKPNNLALMLLAPLVPDGALAVVLLEEVWAAEDERRVDDTTAEVDGIERVVVPSSTSI